MNIKNPVPQASPIGTRAFATRRIVITPKAATISTPKTATRKPTTSQKPFLKNVNILLKNFFNVLILSS